MWIGNMHVNMTKGDYVFQEWKEDSWKEFGKQVHKLRLLGYRKVNQEHDYLNYYEHYRKKGNKRVVTVTMMCW